ncbi:MAG TPA: O-antigen ligase family protein [Pyrinomonadaceae bacterium]|nr:O-antigen ligase family protein [Pyrinomonadaceae bacterium]
MRKLIFGLLVALIAIAAIPYGTVEAWWKAAFVCAVFAICIVAIIESLVSGANRIEGGSVLLPMLALSVLAFVQTISLGSNNVWNAISADPFQTRFFVLQMLALTVFLALLYRYANTEPRVRVLVYTILGVAVASAVFGLLRHTTQQETGFVLPLLRQNQGYGQFINKNHFAYLMEMAFGLGLGILIAGGIARDRVMIYLALLLPIWTGLVLANSRGGILAMLAQVLVAALLLMSLQPSSFVRSSVVKVALVVALVAGVLFGTFWVGGDRLATNFEAARSEFNPDAATSRDGVSRNEIWRASLKMFAAHPFLGVGLGGYWIGITAYHDASGLMTPQEAHNDYLELLSSGGLIGFAIGVWFVVNVVRMVRKNLSVDTGFRRAVRFGAVLGLTGVAAHSLVDFGLHILINAVVFLTLVMFGTRITLIKNG